MTAEPASRRPLDGERIDRRLARIRELLARWAALRPGDGAVWRTGFRPLPEAEVVAAETRLGLRLPENYRRYLLEFGEPAHLLMSYAGQLLSEQRGVRAAAPFPLDGPWAGPAALIDDWEETEGTDFFEEGPGEFYRWLDAPEDVFHDLPAGAGHEDGTLLLGATRGHLLARLVLNGPWAGTVWLDSFGNDGELIHLADETDDFHRDHVLGSFADVQKWLPLTGLPWFPAPEDGPADPAPGDFLDLTIAVLCRLVQRAAAERACDRLGPADFREARLRLRDPRAYGFPAGHRYGSLAPYFAGRVRDELLRPAPDPAAVERLLELTLALPESGHRAAALVLAGRWAELAAFETGTAPDDGRSAVNLALAAELLDAEPGPLPVPTAPDARRPDGERWAVLSALARLDPGRRQRCLDRMPAPDAAALGPLLEVAALPADPAALDGLLAAELSGPERLAATVALVRALHATAADDAPDPALVDRLCALAVAVDRVGEVFDLLAAVSGGRWTDWRAAATAGQHRLDAHRVPA
ncbi:SMI1/KNR4 family protein [Kitasatospora sp. NA04385]|uniref:SMI1/KNR4 family protein n=1 Tax=Kitasatospora sp. NA04385 TaxID=2742135 RepID=UPI0015902684|nr:SMI1/KNR4 family protein [Kitasatospora sp. NA04385]QKW18845.1 SMI1/KNR4 family protein [Kitasatospora sp. NA04385]